MWDCFSNETKVLSSKDLLIFFLWKEQQTHEWTLSYLWYIIWSRKRKVFFDSLIISYSICKGICSKYERTVVIILGWALKFTGKTQGWRSRSSLLHVIFFEKKSKNEEGKSASDKEWVNIGLDSLSIKLSITLKWPSLFRSHEAIWFRQNFPHFGV